MEPPPTIQEAEMPMPLNNTYSGSQSHPHPPHPHGLMTHHHHHPHPIASPQIPPAGPALDEEDDDEDDDEDDYNNNDDDITINHHQVVVPFRKPPPAAAAASARYRECLRNHAAAMGGNATDGCGEFMPGGSGGDAALTCSACGCHRNFHRKETEGEPSHNNSDPRMGRKVYLGHHHHHQHRALFLGQEAYQAHHIPTHVGPHPHHHQMLMPYGISESEMRAPQAKKRFRTKFSQEQKEKMLGFAERVGWKIQKQEEAVVQQFCQEVGVKRRVLKVWMHNNKHSLAKKNSANSDDGHHQIVNNSNDNRVN